MSTHSWQPHGVRLPVARARRSSVRWIGLLLCAALAALIVGAARNEGAAPASAAEAGLNAGLGKLPLSFVPNAGQADRPVRFSAHAGGASFYFTQTEAVLAFARGDEGLALRLGFVGANPAPRIEGTHEQAGTVNYVRGSDSAKWQTGVPTFGEVVYRELWPRIDMVLRGANGRLKYEFVLQPGADARDIRLAYRGAQGLGVSSAGELLIRTPWDTLRDEKPRSFQKIDGRRVPVESRFVLDQSAATYGFAVGAHDARHPLVIDPGLLYATYLGSSGHDEGQDLVAGDDGSMYVTGFAGSEDFPATAGAFDNSSNGFRDAFVTKLGPDGSVVYSTYLGGSNDDASDAIAVDASGSAYVAGSTSSDDFPTTPGSLDDMLGSQDTSDGFVAKLSADGSALVYATYLGGENIDSARGLALDLDDSAYVVGEAQDGFPTTPGAFAETAEGVDNGFVAKLSADGSALVYSTFLGSSSCGLEATRSVVVDAEGNAFVAGNTSADDFPTTPGAFDTTPEGGCDVELHTDAYVTKLNSDGSGLAYSTVLAGDSGLTEFALGIAIDDAGQAFVTGTTESADFPTTPGAFDQMHEGPVEAFVTALDASGSALVFSTFLGGIGPENGTAIAVDADGDVFALGGTSSPDFPSTPGAFDESHNGSEDVYLARLNPSGSELLYSTFLGGTEQDHGLWGLDVDDVGTAVFTGYTNSPDLPTTPDAFDPSHNGDYDAFAARLATEEGPPPSTPGCRVIIDEDSRIVAANGDRAVMEGRARVSETGEPSGREFYRDRGPAEPFTVRSLDLLAVVCSADQKSATVYGTATIDGSGSFDFQIDVEDNARRGRGSDKYRIMLSNGYDSGLQTLTAGNVTIGD